jgi:hypothetical protein
MIRFDASTTVTIFPRIQEVILGSIRLKRLVKCALAMKLLTAVARLVATAFDLANLAQGAMFGSAARPCCTLKGMAYQAIFAYFSLFRGLCSRRASGDLLPRDEADDVAAFMLRQKQRIKTSIGRHGSGDERFRALFRMAPDLRSPHCSRSITNVD